MSLPRSFGFGIFDQSEQIVQLMCKLSDDNGNGKIKYRGFFVSAPENKERVDHLLDQSQDGHQSLDYVNRAIIRNQLVLQAHQYQLHLDLSNHEQMCQELAQLNQCSDYWALVEQIEQEIKMKTEPNVKVSENPDLVVWMYKIRETFYTILIQKLSQTDMSFDYKSDMIYYIRVFDVYRQFLKMILEYHRIIRSQVLGYARWNLILTRRLLIMIDQGSFESWLVFSQIYPEYTNQQIYPIYNPDGIYHNQILVNQLIEDDPCFRRTYEQLKHIFLV